MTLSRQRAAAGPLALAAERAALVLLALPAIAWFALFTIGPLLGMFAMSTMSWTRIVAPASFIGPGNFLRLAGDPLFWKACRTSAIQLGLVLPLMLPTSFLLGYYIAMKPRGHRLLRVLLFTPALLSLAAKSMIFYAIMAPTGLLNGILDVLGLTGLSMPWLANKTTAFPVVIAVDLWSGIGFTAVLFSARLSGVSQDVYEAAELDGASHWQRVWLIAFPMVKDYFGVLTMLQFIWVLFSSAGSILLLTDGGPGDATVNLSFLVYEKAFMQNQIGYSQAVGVVLFCIGLSGVILIRRTFRQGF